MKFRVKLIGNSVNELIYRHLSTFIYLSFYIISASKIYILEIKWYSCLFFKYRWIDKAIKVVLTKRDQYLE